MIYVEKEDFRTKVSIFPQFYKKDTPSVFESFNYKNFINNLIAHT